MRVWLPFPQEYRQQRDVRLIGTTPKYDVLAPTATGEHPLGGAPQRTVYFEQRVGDPPKAITFEETFEFTSAAWYPRLDDAAAKPLPADWTGGNLGERPPHIVFTPALRETVAKVVGDETNPLVRARKLFHFVAEHIAYCAEEEYCTIPSLSDKALTSRRGDCGVQAMLLHHDVPLRRRSPPAGSPAGKPKRRDWNMHDWCEFYVEPWGWLPADPSYGLRRAPTRASASSTSATRIPTA